MSSSYGSVDELPLVEDLAVGRRPARDPYPPPRWSRREVIGFGVRAGAVVGLALLGVFRSVRAAHADFPYGSHAGCGRYDPDTWNGFDGNDNGWFEPGSCAEDACVGVPPDAMGSSYCTTCDEVSGPNPYGWHFTGQRGPFLYGDVPDLCSVNGSARDGWKWQISTCQSCTPATYRCHDGWKLYPNGDLSLTICQSLVECNGAVYSPC